MRPDVNLLPDICEALRITLYQLYALEDPTVQYTAAEELFMADYRQLSPGHKLAVRSLTDTLLQVQTAEEQPEVQPHIIHLLGMQPSPSRNQVVFHFFAELFGA